MPRLSLRSRLAIALMAACAASSASLGAVVSQPAQLLKHAGQFPLRSVLQPGEQSSQRSGAPASTALVNVIELDRDAYEQSRAASSVHVSLPLGGQSVGVDLERFEVFTADAQILEHGPDGEHVLPRPDALYFSGHIAGDAESHVFLSLSPLGTFGLVRSSVGEFSISTIAATANSPLAGRTTIVNLAELSDEQAALIAANPARAAFQQSFACAGAVLPPGVTAPAPQTQLSPVIDRGPGGVCRVIRAAIDTDTEFTTALFAGNSTNSSAYIGTLMAAVSSVYARDIGVALQVSFMRVWTTADPYSAANTGAELTEFRNYWLANRPAVAHDLAHLLCGRSLGGGIAYLNALCNTNFNLGVCANLGGSFPQPLADNRSNNWDPYVVAHEMGHNFGSGHTHEPSAYSPPIDGCGNAYLSPPQPQDCTVASALNGTIMSYCHLCSGGVANLKMTFGPRPISVIQNFLSASVPNCGSFLSTPNVNTTITVAGPRCPGASPTMTVTATPAAGEVLTYRWFRGSTQLIQTTPTITIFNLNAASATSYTCVVSNGCQSVIAGPVTLALCKADVNCSATVTVQDIFDFLTSWFGASPSADINGVNGVSTQDIFDFMALWFAGC